jgi:hypothetical protein
MLLPEACAGARDRARPRRYLCHDVGGRDHVEQLRIPITRGEACEIGRAVVIPFEQHHVAASPPNVEGTWALLQGKATEKFRLNER